MAQTLLREQERDRRQAILDWHVEQKRGAEEAERAYWREIREALDPFDQAIGARGQQAGPPKRMRPAGVVTDRRVCRSHLAKRAALIP